MKRKSVSLLTRHYSLSPGAVMQTYALCKMLESLGVDVNIINLKNPEEKNRRRSLRFWLSSGIVKLRFDAFRKKYFPKMTKEMFVINPNLLPKTDAYISGSDQIWNPNIVGNNLPAYMLSFVPDSFQKFSYASSFGVNSWDFDNKISEQVKSYLSKYNKLSVREDTGVTICKDKFNIDAVQVLDPTLLLADYSELLPRKIEIKNQLVIFKLVQDEEFYKVQAYLKSKTGLRTVLLYTNRPRFEFDQSVMFCSPQLWLSKLASARLVLTDSFHGLAFSIIFRKNFIVLGGPEGKTTRLKSLLSILNLEDRFINTLEELKNKPSLYSDQIDYDIVYEKLKKERDYSLEYLKSIVRSL